MKKVMMVLAGMVLSINSFAYSELNGTVAGLHVCELSGTSAIVIVTIDVNGVNERLYFNTSHSNSYPGMSAAFKYYEANLLTAFMSNKSVNVSYDTASSSTQCGVTYNKLVRGVTLGTK
jgi:hypothetical protein